MLAVLLVADLKINSKDFLNPNSILLQFLKTEILNNKNLNMSTSLNAKQIDKFEDLVDFILKVKISEGLIDINETSISWLDTVDFKISDSLIYMKNNNLFLSQSCLEHVRYDLKFFHDIKKKFKKSKKKSILIKCVPSPFCLFTYLTHGYRQYNTKNLNKISNVLGSDNLFVIKLGSFFLNLEHLKNTTLPLIYKKKDMMKSQNKFYYNKINNLIVKNKTGSLFFSSFSYHAITNRFNCAKNTRANFF